MDISIEIEMNVHYNAWNLWIKHKIPTWQKSKKRQGDIAYCNQVTIGKLIDSGKLHGQSIKVKSKTFRTAKGSDVASYIENNFPDIKVIKIYE